MKSVSTSIMRCMIVCCIFASNISYIFAEADDLLEKETCFENSEKTTKIRLGLEWFLNPDHLPIVVALEHGIFKDFGLDIELIEPNDHWEAEKEILDGRLDVATTEPLHLAMDAMNGKPVLGFSRFFHTDGGVMFKKGDIERPRDMCGKTITYPGYPGPGGPAIVQTMIEADGGTCDLSSYGKYDGGFFHTDAIESGNADLATLIFWNFEIPEAEARELEVDFFSLKDYGVPDFCQLILFTTPSRFEELKDDLRKMVLAMRKATGIIHRYPELAKQYYISHVGQAQDDEAQKIQIATLQATLPAFPNDNSMSDDYYLRLMSWLSNTGQVDSGLQAEVPSFWTNEISW